MGAELEVCGLGHWGEEGRFEMGEVNKWGLLGSGYQGLKF